MIVDDRLETVLRTQTAGQAGHHTQLRQLVDIVGRTPAAAWTDQHDRALTRIDTLHRDIGDAAAAVLIGSCAMQSPRLIAHLVAKGPRTALVAIGRARISDAQWLQLVPTLPIHARGALRHRRDLSPPVLALLGQLGIDDFVLSPPAQSQPGAAPAPVAHETSPLNPIVVPIVAPIRPESPIGGESDVPQREGIGAIVRRIEAFRRTRDNETMSVNKGAQASGRETHHLVGQQAQLFALNASIDPPVTLIDIATDAAGTIVAADGVDPAMLIGHAPFTPASAAAAASVDTATLAAVHARRPIVAGGLRIDGAPRIAGAWRIDGVPLFGADGGQFTGYRVRLRRPAAAIDAVPAEAPAHPGADALHQLLHELRTPINAIQGFAELIQQQLIGPTPHQYRSLAASIAADAARMLAGFEDVERLVQLETGRMPIEPGESDLAAIVARMITQLEPLIVPREIRLRWAVPPVPVPIAMPQAEAERTVWRLLATLVTAAAPGERLSMTLDLAAQSARLRLTLPQALALRDTEALFAPDMARGGMTGAGANLGGMLGNGFALRLCDAELRAVGGGLDRPGGETGPVLDMTLPLPHALALDRNAAAS
jgi:signal transduction histidine kinase